MNPNRVKEILEYIKGSPETMDYGRWGALNQEQRKIIKELCNSWLILDEATNMQTKEIERIKELSIVDSQQSQEIIIELNKEIERLNNIINEVREYIESNQEEHKFTDRGGFTYTEGHFLRDSDTLLEILDKENVKAIPPEVIGTNGEDGWLFDYGDKGE